MNANCFIARDCCQAKQYETCIEIYSLLVQAYKSVKNYSKLMDCLTEFKLLTEVLIETVRK